MLKTIVAFAYTAGGVIVPRLVPEIEILPWRRTQLVAVQVHPSPARPHYLKREGPTDGVYVRVGSTNRRADREMVEELRRYARGEAFDEQPMPGLGSEAVDFRAASESFAPVRKLARRDLETLRLVTSHQGRLVPTVGGMILFGRDSEQHFPDAWIVAVREAVTNAVTHADYAQRGAPLRVSIFDDRLEVENPGLLPFGLTLDDLPQGVPKLRNRVIGRVFHALGLVKQWGSGIQRMTTACRDSGLGAPVFEEVSTRFRVTISSARTGRPTFDAKDEAILAGLARADGMLTSEVAKAIGLSARATRTRLARLVGHGLAREIGAGPQDPRRRYFRMDRGQP